jgi:hypothetical protein
MNKEKFAYFYTDQTKKVKSETSGLITEHYEVIRVKVFNNSVDEAERKARTINDKLGRGPMPGGYSIGEGDKIPFGMPERYTVINCPDKTKIQPYSDKDKAIIALIESETHQDADDYPIILQKLFDISEMVRNNKSIKRDIKIIITRNLSSVEKQIKKIFFTS